MTNLAKIRDSLIGLSLLALFASCSFYEEAHQHHRWQMHSIRTDPWKPSLYSTDTISPRKLEKGGLDK